MSDINKIPTLYRSAIFLALMVNVVHLAIFLWFLIDYKGVSEIVLEYTNLLAMEGVSRLFIFLNFITQLISLFFLLLIVKGKKGQIISYIITQVLYLLLPLFFIGNNKTSTIYACYILVVSFCLVFYGIIKRSK